MRLLLFLSGLLLLGQVSGQEAKASSCDDEKYEELYLREYEKLKKAEEGCMELLDAFRTSPFGPPCMEDIYEDSELVSQCPVGNVKDTLCSGKCNLFDTLNAQVAFEAACKKEEKLCEYHWQDHCYRTSHYHLCRYLGVCISEEDFNAQYCDSASFASLGLFCLFFSFLALVWVVQWET